MAITLTTGTPAASNSGTSVVATVPVQTVGAVNFLPLIINLTSGITVTPAGWNPVFGASGLQPNGTSNTASNVFWRAWQTGDPTTVTLTMATAGRMLALPFGATGIDTTAPIESSGSTVSGSIGNGLPIPAPTLTAAASRLLVTFHTKRYATTNATGAWFAPNGMTEMSQSNSTASSGVTNVGAVTASLVLTAAGATGVKNAVVNQGGFALGFSMLLTEGSAAPAGSQLFMKGGVPVTARYKGQP